MMDYGKALRFLVVAAAAACPVIGAGLGWLIPWVWRHLSIHWS